MAYSDLFKAGTHQANNIGANVGHNSTNNAESKFNLGVPRLSSEQATGNWFSGSQPTLSETIAQIYKIGSANPEMQSQLNDAFNYELTNPESPIYQPYLMPTTDKVNDTNIRNTNNATNEWNQLQAELAYWANRTDRNYSDDEIINRINMTKYPTLAKMDAYKTTGVTMDLLAPVGYSKDAMYGVLWSARNGGQTSGNYLVDAAQGIMGNGNKYQRDEDLYGRRDATSDNYAPYTVGATALDDLSYKYGMQGDFTMDWLNGEGRALLNGDEQSKKDYNLIYTTVMNTQKLNAEAEKFNADVQKAIQIGEDPAVYFREGFMEARYPELYKALQGQRSGKLYETSGAVAFDYDKAVRDMQASYDSIHGTKPDEEFESEIGAATGNEFFSNEADQMDNAYRELNTQVNLADYVDIVSSLELTSMKLSTGIPRSGLRANAGASDVSSWVGNSVKNGTGGEVESKMALQSSAHDFANNNIFDAWDVFNENSRSPESYLGEDAQKFLMAYFSDQFVREGRLPTEEEIDAVAEQQSNPKAFYEALRSFQPQFSEGYRQENVDARAAKKAEAQEMLDEIYDGFAEVYGEGTEQYYAAVNTYKMAYQYKDGFPKNWSAFDAYQIASNAEGAIPESLAISLENSRGDVARQILKLTGLIENAKIAGIPQEMIDNMESQLADLKNQNVVLGAHYFQNEEGYADAVKEFDANSEEIKLNMANLSKEEGQQAAALIVDPTAFDKYIDVNATGLYITPEVKLKEAVAVMTDEERSNYKYLYVTKGPEEAAAYFDALYENLTVRHAEDIESQIKGFASSGAGEMVVSSVGSTLLTIYEASDAIQAVGDFVLGDDYNPYEYHATRIKNSLREGSKELLTGGATENTLAGLLYDGIMGISDSMMLGKGFGKWGSAGLMALSGFNSALSDATERGVMDDKALLYALSCAAIEFGTEHMSYKRLANAFKIGSGEVTKEAVQGFFKTVVKGFGGEGVEELVSGFGSTIADDVFNQSMSQYKTLVSQYIELGGLSPEEAENQATKDILSGLMYEFMAGGIGGAFGSSVEYGKGATLRRIGETQQDDTNSGNGTAPQASDGQPSDAQVPVETEQTTSLGNLGQVLANENAAQETETENAQDENAASESENVAVQEAKDANEVNPVDETVEQEATETGTVQENVATENDGSVSRATAALATASKNGVSAHQKAATVKGVLTALGLDEMEASAVAKNIVESDNIRSLRKVLSSTTNPELVVKAVAMGSLVEDSQSAEVFKNKITSKNAYDVSEQLIAAYESDRINKHATSAYDANVAFSTEADIATEIVKTNGKVDHKAEQEATAKLHEAQNLVDEKASAHQAAQAEFENVAAEFNNNPFDDALKERFQTTFDALQDRIREHLDAVGKLSEARKNLDAARDEADVKRTGNMVAAREQAKAQVAEQVQHKREAQEANAKKEAQAVVNPTSYIDSYFSDAEHTQDEIDLANEYRAAVSPVLLDAAKQYRLNGKLDQKYVTLGNVTAKERNAVQAQTGVDVSGYVHSVNSDFFSHVENRHGISGQENKSMADLNDIARAEWVIENADSVELVTKPDGTPATTKAFKDKNNNEDKLVRFKKRVDGHVYVVEAVGENAKKRLWLITAYIQKNGNESNSQSQYAQPVPDGASTPEPYVQNEPSDATKSISQTEGKFNASNNVNAESGVVAEVVRGDSDVRAHVETNNQITNQAEGQTVVNQANSKDQGVSQFAAKTGQNTTVLSDNVKTQLRESPFYQKTSQKKNVDRAIASIESEGYDVRKSKMLDGTTNIYTPEGQVEAYVLLKAAKESGDFQGESALAFKVKESGTTIAQSLAMRQMYSEMSNEGKVLFVQRLVDQINKRYEDRGKDTRVKVPEWLSKRLEEAGNDAEAVAKVIDDAYADIANQMPPDWRTRMNAWRYMAMLANPKTHVKNFLGNMMFLPVVRFKNQIGALGELTIPQEERTKTFGLIKSEYKDFAKEKLKEVSDVLTGGGKHNPISEIESKRKSFNWKILEYVSKGNGKFLEKEDAFYLNKHFVNSLAGFLQARNVDVTNVDEKTLQAGLDYAITEAQKATFRDASVLADKLSKFSTDLSNSKKRSARFGGLLVEGAVPFKKTPINIARRGVEYSPLGLLNTLTYGIADVKSGKIETTEFIDRLASGMTGTALSAVGAFLYSLGHIKIGLADKEDELEKLAGSQEYSIEIFGKSYTIDWVSPAAMPLFVGAELAELISSDDKELNLSSLWDAMLKITEPVFNLTMLDGVNSLLSAASFSENGVAGIAERAAENYVTQFVPSVLGAFARIADPVRRTTYTDKNIDIPSSMQYVFDNVRNKTPFWSFDGQPYLNAWGEEDVEENLVVRIFENIVSPGYLNDVEPDEVEKFLMELYDTTKEPGLVPKTPQKYFTVEGERKDLTGQEYEQLTKERGQTSKKLHEELISNPDFLTLPAQYQVYALEQVWEYATQTAKKNVEPRVALASWVAGAADNPAEAIMEKVAEKMKKDRSDAMKKDLYSAVDSGDVETAATYVAGIIDGGTEKSSLKSAVTSHYKSIYISLYESGDYEGMAELKETLLSLGLGYKPADIEKWLVPKEEK